ncbi:MAG: hypothetical protein ACKO16_18935 [Gemmataceae bacterium]|mgnify:CR=1 FL=1|jgi:hypothetical protein
MSNSFSFSQAAYPAEEINVGFSNGYRKSVFTDSLTQQDIPMLAITVSKESVFDIFLQLTDILGDTVDVILESSHGSKISKHIDLHREEIDLPILQSYLQEFEEVISNDGCSGVAVMAKGRPMEVQFDEHKVIVVYAQNIGDFEKVLLSNKIPRNDAIPLVNDFEHFHSTTDEYENQFNQLTEILGCSEPAESNSW